MTAPTTGEREFVALIDALLDTWHTREETEYDHMRGSCSTLDMARADFAYREAWRLVSAHVDALHADIARVTGERDRHEAELKRCVHEALQHSHTPEQLAAMMDAWPDASTQVHAVMHSYDECRDALATAQHEAAGLREENVRMRDAVRALLDLPAYQAWERLIMKNTPAPEAGR